MVYSLFVSGGSSLASVVAGSKPTKPLNKPDFDDISPRNVTAIVEQTAELNCFVKHPGDRVVSNAFPSSCSLQEILDPRLSKILGHSTKIFTWTAAGQTLEYHILIS